MNDQPGHWNKPIKLGLSWLTDITLPKLFDIALGKVCFSIFVHIILNFNLKIRV